MLNEPGPCPLLPKHELGRRVPSALFPCLFRPTLPPALLLSSFIIPPLLTATSLSGSAAWRPHLSEYVSPPLPSSFSAQTGRPAWAYVSSVDASDDLDDPRQMCEGSCALNSHGPLRNQLLWPPVVQVHLHRTRQPFFENVTVMGKERSLWILCAPQPCGNALYVGINLWEVLFGCPLSLRHRMNVRWKSAGKRADTSHMEATVSPCASGSHRQHQLVVPPLRA